MPSTYTIDETFDGKRTISSPDPDNEGQSIETEIDVRDVIVTFTSDTVPEVIQTRNVNVCYDADGDYDSAATVIRVEEVQAGFDNKVISGILV